MSMLETIRFTSRVLHRARTSRARPEKVAELQERRLRRLLRFAVEHSRFYRDKFRGIDVTRCRLEDLPITTKAEMMERFDDLITDPQVRQSALEQHMENPDNIGNLYLGRYPVCHTSGSVGRSLLVVQSPQTVELIFGFHMTRGNVDYGRGPVEAVRRFLRPSHAMVFINRPGFFPSSCIFKQIPRPLARYVRFLYVTGSDPDLEAKFREFKPRLLIGTPSVLDVVALRADRFDLSNLRQVTSISETLSDAARQRLERAFGVTVIDNYSSGECLFLSSGCRNGKGMHVNADWAILENVDDAYRPVPPGAAGTKALMTNLANTVQPFIRYEVPDRIVMADSDCGCGNRLPRIERIDGRSADFFWIRVGNDYRSLVIYPFQHSLEYLRNVREWQAVQKERNRILVRLEPLPGATIDLELVRRRLGERLEGAGVLDHVELEIEIVDRLDWDWRTGKLRRMVTLVGPPEDLPADRPRGALVKKGESESFDASRSLIAAAGSAG